jgi:hypothetical protein
MACKVRCFGQLERETYNVFVQTLFLLATHFALCFAHELALECLFLVGTRPLFLGQDLGSVGVILLDVRARLLAGNDLMFALSRHELGHIGLSTDKL